MFVIIWAASIIISFFVLKANRVMHREDRGRGHEKRKAGGLWKVEKARTLILPESLKKEFGSSDTLMLAPLDPGQMSDLQSYKIMYLWLCVAAAIAN